MARRQVRGRSGLPRWRRGWASGVALLGAGLLGTAAGRPLHAQPVVGGFDDATVPGRGETRIRLGGIFSTFDDRYGGFSTAPDDRRAPAGSRYTFDALGVAQLPLLSPLQQALAGITEGTPEAVSLGRTVGLARGSYLTFPVSGELGITRRFSLGVTVPTVRSRHVVDVRVNPDGTTGNIGFNPAIEASFPSAALAAGARERNRAVQTQFTAAVTALQQLLTTCPTSSTGTVPAGCERVVANRAAATALVTSATSFAQGVARVYGAGSGTSANGLAFVPVAGSSLQQQVERRLAALRQQFRDFGIESIATGTAPVGSPARIAAAGLQRILVTPAFGIQADSLASITRSSTGDIDVVGNVLLVDTFGAGLARLTPTGFHVRATATAGFRVGFSGGEDAPTLLTDLPTAGGENALLFRGAADLAFGRRAWATVAARWASPLADEQVVRITDVPEQPFPGIERQQLVGRKLGRELELQLTPRWSFGDYLAVAAQYSLRDKAADEFTGTFTLDSAAGGGALDASTLGIGTAAREQRVGFGLTYSTVAAYLKRRSNVPIEVSLLHLETISGSGGIPKLSTDVIQLRIYPGLRRPR
jgi:hypothetical protein